MGFYGHDLTNDLLISLEFSRIQLSSDKSAESVFYALSNEKFGKVSRAAQDVLKRVKKGEELKNAVEKSTKKYGENMKSLFSQILREDSRSGGLDELTESIFSANAIKRKKISGRIQTLLTNSIYLSFAPFFVLIIDYFTTLNLDSTIPGFAFIDTLSSLRIYILLVAIIIILMLSLRVRLDQND